MNEKMLQDFAKYTDRYGLVQNRIPDSEGETSGNGLLFTAEAILVLRSYDFLPETLKASYLKAIKSCELVPGLYARFPGDTDQEAVDDYVGLCAADKILSSNIAQKILDYGQKSKFSWGPFKFKYYYENENPYNSKDIRGWLGRQPQLIAHFKFGNNERVSLFRRLWWFLAVSTSGLFDPKNTNAWTLSWLLVKTMDQESLLCHLGSAIWRYRLKKNWGSMRAVFVSYFDNALHPIAVYCKE